MKCPKCGGKHLYIPDDAPLRIRCPDVPGEGCGYEVPWLSPETKRAFAACRRYLRRMAHAMPADEFADWKRAVRALYRVDGIGLGHDFKGWHKLPCEGKERKP